MNRALLTPGTRGGTVSFLGAVNTTNIIPWSDLAEFTYMSLNNFYLMFHVYTLENVYL